MKTLGTALVALVAALHVYIAWFEIFAWTTRGPKVFSSFPPELFEPTIAFAANQGTYNAFLAAGLIWSLFISDTVWRYRIAVCFLSFVFVAGVVASLTVSFSTGLPQMVPSAIALLVLTIARRNA